ncbi:MAG: hypothetical protein ACRDUA_24520, partial [Micromonosporaceae bacterium]
MGQLSDENLTTKAPARQVVTQRRPEVISEPVPPAARPAPPDLGEAVRTAVALGWQLSQLYADAEDSPDDDDADEAEPTVAAGQHIGTDPAARTPRAAPGSPSPALSPALPSMSRLPLHTQSELRVTQVLARVVRLQVQFGDRDGGVWPVTTLQRLQHERASNEAIRAAVPLLHEDLLRAMTWVDVRVAKAYSLGADLERYTRRPTHPARHSDRSDGPASLQGQVRPEVTRQIHRALRDLTTVLPDHAAETVTMSLLAWDRAVNAQRPTTERPKQSWPDTLHR